MLLMIFLLIMIIVLSFKFKEKVIGKTGNDRTKGFEIMVLLKYLRIFEEPLKCH